MLWTFEAGCRRERPPVSLLCYCHNHTAVQRELNADRPIFVSESGTRRRRRHPQPLGAKAMFAGVSRVTSLFHANSLSLGHPDAFVATDSEGFPLHLWGGKKNPLFF